MSLKPLDITTFYFNLPLYYPIKIDESNQNEFGRLLQYNGNIDFYHPNLKENTTYALSPCTYNSSSHFYQYGGVNTFRLTCVRTNEEFFIYVFYDSRNRIFQKIGQYPSIATFHISQIKKYDKVLNKEKLKEFTRAIGLAANGVGIGSFVYLRRIFEGLIEEAHLEAKKTASWNEDTYRKQKVVERIQSLKDFLPEFLVENKELYGILSVGIHRLEEEECLSYFQAVKLGIEIILDEKVEELMKRKKLEEARKSIASISSNIKN